MNYDICCYHVITYVSDISEDVGIDFAILAFSELRPGFMAMKRVASWSAVLENDADADTDVLNEFLDELPAQIRLDPNYLDRILQWENCIRFLAPRRFRTSDFLNTFLLVANAELGALSKD